MRPSLLIDPARTKRVDPRLTVTRTSTATYFDAFGVMRSSAAGVLRVDHDPATGECEGFMVEESRTNLLTYSEQFDNAAWGKGACSVTANATTAPDGQMSADKIVEDTATNVHYIFKSLSATAGTAYTISVYAKAAERSEIRIEASTFNGVFDGAYAYFNLLTGTVRVNVGTGIPVIEACKDGWYRCSFTQTALVSAGALVVAGQLSNGTTTFYTGNGTSGLYLWGAQFEANSTPSSYIPTTSATVTRSADLVSLSSAGFGTFANSAVACTYSQTGTVMTITDTAHGRVAGEKIYIDCTSGSSTDLWATVASVTDANTYVINHYISVTTSGNATRSSGYLSDWYKQDEGTFIVTAKASYAQTDERYMLIAGVSGAGRHQMTVAASTSSLSGASVNDSAAVTNAGTGTGSLLGGTAKTFCYSYKDSDFAGASDGVVVSGAGQSGGDVPAVSTLSIGSAGDGGRYLNGHVYKLAYYPKRLTVAELSALSLQ